MNAVTTSFYNITRQHLDYVHDAIFSLFDWLGLKICCYTFNIDVNVQKRCLLFLQQWCFKIAVFNFKSVKYTKNQLNHDVENWAFCEWHFSLGIRVFPILVLNLAELDELD